MSDSTPHTRRGRRPPLTVVREDAAPGDFIDVDAWATAYVALVRQVYAAELAGAAAEQPGEPPTPTVDAR